jgi:hypothetical protein
MDILNMYVNIYNISMMCIMYTSSIISGIVIFRRT